MRIGLYLTKGILNKLIPITVSRNLLFVKITIMVIPC